MMPLETQPVAPFDLSLTLAFLAGFSPTRGEQEVTDHEVTKAFFVRGRPVAVRARGVGRDRERPAPSPRRRSGCWRATSAGANSI